MGHAERSGSDAVEPPYQWDEAGTVSALNRRIYEAVRRRVHVRQPRRILDVGCGSGVLCAMLASDTVECVGLDASETGLAAARRRGSQARFVLGSCYATAAETGLGRFDVVTASEVIEHLVDPRRFLRAALTHLAPGGRLILTTPDYGSYWRNLFISVVNRWDQHHSPLWDGGHIKFWSRRTLGALLDECGLTPTEWGGVRSVRVPVFNASLVCVAEAKL